jgi:hypothetical protein
LPLDKIFADFLGRKSAEQIQEEFAGNQKIPIRNFRVIKNQQVLDTIASGEIKLKNEEQLHEKREKCNFGRSSGKERWCFINIWPVC